MISDFTAQKVRIKTEDLILWYTDSHQLIRAASQGI